MSAQRIARTYGIRTVRSAYVKSAEAAKRFAGSSRIVLKAIPNVPAHKSGSGLVAVGVDARGIEGAFMAISSKAKKYGAYKMLAQEMISGTEIILGGKNDAQFGKMVLLGLGGIYVEVFKDFALRLCPLSKHDALDMIDQLRSCAAVAPDAKSKDRLADLIVKVSRMYSGTRINELDLNPVILHDGTYDAVDLRMIE
jgi:hypothetical protein